MAPPPPDAQPGDDRRIADALVATLCAGVSLELWSSCGILEREWEVYRTLSGLYGRIVLVTEGGPRERDLARKLPAACPVEVVDNPEGLERAAMAPEACRRVVEHLRGAGSALVRAEQFWGGGLALALAGALRGAGLRTGLVARGGYPWSRFVAWEAGADSARASEAAAEEGELCRAADVVIGTTERMLDDLCWRYGLSRARTALVPNFVPEEACPAPGVAREPGLVLFAGRLVAQKRIGLLIDAMGLVGAEARALGSALAAPPRLEVVGEGELEPSLRERALVLGREAGVEVSFHRRMAQGALLERMRRCAVYAQVSAYEGHPKTVLEAMACGAPVVVAEAPGLSDVVEPGVTGLVARPEARSVTRALARVLTDSDLASSLGRAGAAGAADLRPGVTLGLEARAHRLAVARAGEGAGATPGAVRWGPELLSAPAEEAAAAWARSLHGYARRLGDERRARFCAAVETPVYDVIDRAAIETAGGVHPKHHLMRYHDFFVERIGAGEQVLDLGCGYGAVARSIAERAGAMVTGMDFSAENVRLAREMAEREGLAGRLRVLEGDITSLRATRADGGTRFDVVVLSNVLEHLADRERLLALYLAWYEPRAMLIRVPAFDRNWQTAWKTELGVDWRCDDTHETEYTEGSLRAELAAAGLGVAEMISRWGEYWVRAEAES